VVASVAFVATGIAGWFGCKLVQTHHVGVDDRPRPERAQLLPLSLPR
jgi:hypothetical protein